MKFFQLIPSGTNFDFIGKFKPFAIVSALIMAGVMVLFFTKGLNYGIDFTGGTVLQVRFPQPMNAEDARKLVSDFGVPDASVVSASKDNRDYLITSRTIQDLKGASPLQMKFQEKYGKGSILSADVVGPKVGKELKWAAGQSLFYSIVLITIYIWFRFDIRFAPGATIAMLHDVVLATGFYILSGYEFTITAVAALLTIAGYSVNDTIVIYDRVREMMKAGGDVLPTGQVINNAINITLSRTVLTSGVTFLSIIPIAIFCEGEIKDFAVAMLIGIFVGTYSTMYVAAPFTIYVEKWLGTGNKKKTNPTRPIPVTTGR